MKKSVKKLIGIMMGLVFSTSMICIPANCTPVGDVVLLSDNIFNEQADVPTYYPQFNDGSNKIKRITTGATRQWEAVDSAPSTGNQITTTMANDDITRNLLVNKDPNSLTNADGNHLLHSQWWGSTTTSDTQRWAKIVFDLKGDYNISRVDVWTQFVSGESMMGHFDVSLSLDGNTFSPAYTSKETGTNTNAVNSDISLPTVAEFEPSLARYVEITMYVNVGYKKMRLSEILIFGQENHDLRVDLANSIIAAQNMDKKIYTIASWETVELALTDAIAVYYDSNATDAEIENAIDMLSNAVSGLIYLYETKILTDNNFYESDLAIYDTPKEITGVVYDYIDIATATNLPANDVDRQKLKSGSLQNDSGNYAVFGAWNGDNDINIVYTFLNEYYINQVDVWSNLNTTGSQRMDRFKVQVSTNGIDYDEVANVTNPYNKDIVDFGGKASLFVNTSASFSPVKAKYVKITTTRSNNQQTLGEIIIKGFKAPASPVIQFALFDLEYTTGTDVPLNKLSNSEGNIIVEGEVFNNSSEEKPVVVISALYSEDKRLIAVSVDYITAAVATRTPFDMEMTGLPALSDSCILRTYVWSDISDCVPLSATKTYGDLFN